MKKGMMVMAMLVALSFLVSISAVSPSFAKPASQTTPTSKQQAPAQTPATQSPQTQKSQFTPPKDQQYSPAKAKFWGFELDHCVVTGNNLNPCNAEINIKQGAPLTGTCYYKVKTITINEITEWDANRWGKGKSYLVRAALINCEDSSKFFGKDETRKLPLFTWRDVQKWKSAGQGNAPKIWTERFDFIWIPTKAQTGKYLFTFQSDAKNEIEEYDGRPNNNCTGVINITP